MTAHMCSQVHTRMSVQTFTLSAGGGASGGCLALTLTGKVWPLVHVSGQPSCQALVGKGARAPGQPCTKVGEMEVPQLRPTLCSWENNCCDCAPQSLGPGATWLSTREGQAEPACLLSPSWPRAAALLGCRVCPCRGHTPRQVPPLPHPQVPSLPPSPSSLSPSLNTLPLLLQQQRNQLSATPHPTVHSLLRADAQTWSLTCRLPPLLRTVLSVFLFLSLFPSISLCLSSSPFPTSPLEKQEQWESRSSLGDNY